MEITESRIEGHLLVGLAGRLDAATSVLLEPLLNARLEGGETHFVLDCRELHYLSSAGMKILFAAAKRAAKSGGRIVIAGAKKHVLDVIHLGGLDEMIPHAPTIEAALALG